MNLKYTDGKMRLYNVTACKILLAEQSQSCVASPACRTRCPQLPPADQQWSEPAPGSGPQGHSYMTEGNSLSSAIITKQCCTGSDGTNSKISLLGQINGKKNLNRIHQNH